MLNALSIFNSVFLFFFGFITSLLGLYAGPQLSVVDVLP